MPQLNGLGNLFNALANGDSTRNQAYTNTLYRGARAEGSLLDARRKQDELQALAAFAATPEGQSAIGQALMANLNPQQLTGAQTDQQLMGFRQQAQQHYAAEHPGQISNSFLAAINGKPVTHTAQSGGIAFDPTAGPNQTLVETPAHKSELANAFRTATATGSDKQPPDFHALNSTAAKYFSAPLYDQDGNIRTDMYGNVIYGFSPEKYGEFASWWATSGIPDQNAALATYIRQQRQPPQTGYDPLGILGGSHGAIQR